MVVTLVTNARVGLARRRGLAPFPRLVELDDVQSIKWVDRNVKERIKNINIYCFSRTLFTLLDDLPVDVKSRVARMAFDGTSGTALLLDRNTGAILQPAKLYNEKQPVESLLAAQVSVSLLYKTQQLPWPFSLLPNEATAFRVTPVQKI